MENLENNIQSQGQEGQIEGTQPVTYSEAQVQEMLQRETDRRVTAALQKQQAKFESKMQESEKLRNMDESQRKQYEFEARMKEFEEEKKAFALDRNKLEAAKVMSNRGLPVSFVDYIVAEDAETMMANIENFEIAFKAAVNDAVSKKIASPNTPKAGSVEQFGMTKEQFKSLSISQQQDLYFKNPELYKRLAQ